MTLPNFLILGAAKSGTTAIYTYIKQHPQIYMSPRKELRYFSNHIEVPNNVPMDYVHRGVKTLEEYEHYFDAITSETIYGESSPMYLYYPGVAERIKETIPNAKLFAILRNPVDRAYSAYTHGLREWKEPAKSFEEALSLESEREQIGWGMLWQFTKVGFYYQQLKRYYDIFDPGQIMVVLYDDLRRSVDNLLKDIFTFLKVDPDFNPDTSARPNVSGFPKSKLTHEMMRHLFLTDNPIKRIGRKIFRDKFRRQTINNIRELNLEKRKMSQETRKELNQVFYEEIQNLEKLIDRDLSHWIK